jgi:YesN/AraC family two-component response regulator
VKPKRVLIIDDDPSLLDALTTALCPRYRVLAAHDSTAACSLLRNEPVDLIILDLYLGAEDGLDLLPRLRALTSAPVLLLTGFGTRENLLRVIQAKPDDFLEKPVGVGALRARVSALLGEVLPANDPIERVRARIASEYKRPLTLRALARLAGMSQAGFRRAFVERCGVTPATYLTQCRMRQAAVLLADPAQLVKEVAAHVGYPDANNFSTAFKRFHGAPPRAFRARRLL